MSSPPSHLTCHQCFCFSRSWKSHQLFYSFNQSSHFKGPDHWLIACWEFYRVQPFIGLDSVRYEQHVSIDLNFSAWVQTFVFCMKVLLSSLLFCLFISLPFHRRSAIVVTHYTFIPLDSNQVLLKLQL